MFARDSYDEEHVVKRTEVSVDPVATTQPAEVRTVREVAPAAPVVREDVVVDQPVVVAPDHEAVASEMLSIDRVTARRSALDRVGDGIWFLVGLLEITLALRVAFKLFEANTANGFVRFINGFTDPFVRPFNGVFSEPSSNGAVLDSNALLAMVIYLIIAWALVRLVWLLFDRTETGARRAVYSRQRDVI